MLLSCPIAEDLEIPTSDRAAQLLKQQSGLDIAGIDHKRSLEKLASRD